MNAFEILANEHGLIRQYLDNLSLAAEKIESGGRPPREFFEKAVSFARRFADKYHHHKEELVMFTRLAQSQNGEIDDQIEVLRKQHERGRQCVNGIEECTDGFVDADPIKTDQMLSNLAVYVSNLRRHIHLEDHVFFPLCRSKLSKDEREQLKIEFDMDRERFGPTTFEECHKDVVDMGSMLVHM